MNITHAPNLDAPFIAHRQPDIKRPKMSLAMSLFVVALVLNCIVIATPLRPAIIGESVYETSFITWPGSQWRSIERYPICTSVHYFWFQNNRLWVVQVDYDMERLDLTGPELNYKQWMSNYLYSIVSNVTNQLAAQFTPGMTDHAKLTAYLEFFRDTELQSQLQATLVYSFNRVYNGLAKMRGMEISVKNISVQEYRGLISD